MASSFTPFPSQTTLIIIIITILSSSSLSSASTPKNGTHPHHPRGPFKKLYAFGDSFTDTGNAGSLNGSHAFGYASEPKLPYGSTFFHHPAKRYSDGRLIIDFVAEALSMPFLPAWLDSKADVSHGMNFAVGGATAISHDFFVKNNLSLARTPQSLQTQLVWFEKVLEKEGCTGKMSWRECDKVFEEALIWVGEIGVCDYAYTIGFSVPGSIIQDLAVKSVTDFLEALLKKGAKYIVVQGLPPSGCLPLVMILLPDTDRDDLGCVGSVNKQHNSHNIALQAKLHDLRLRFPHAVIVYADYWNSYRTVMKNAHNYGFNESFKACCGTGEEPYNFDLLSVCGSPNTRSCKTPSQHINWDGFHLTEAMYKVVSDKFLRGSFCHPSFHYLLTKKQHQAGIK